MHEERQWQPPLEQSKLAPMHASPPGTGLRDSKHNVVTTGGVGSNLSKTMPESPGLYLRASGQESRDGLGLGASFNSDGRSELGRASMQSHDLNNLENLRSSYNSRASYGHELQIPLRQVLDNGGVTQVILNLAPSIQYEI